jgi:hypothetical protein
MFHAVLISVLSGWSDWCCCHCSSE